jgi:hypothetical protein
MRPTAPHLGPLIQQIRIKMSAQQNGLKLIFLVHNFVFDHVLFGR